MSSILFFKIPHLNKTVVLLQSFLVVRLSSRCFPNYTGFAVSSVPTLKQHQKKHYLRNRLLKGCSASVDLSSNLLDLIFIMPVINFNLGLHF